jgi:hypothetical protein
VRYLNHSGKVAIIEPQAAPTGLGTATDEWLAIASQLAAVIETWDEQALPPLPPGHTRILMLTPGGPRFGQGPDSELRLDAAAAAYLTAATKVVKIVVNLVV